MYINQGGLNLPENNYHEINDYLFIYIYLLRHISQSKTPFLQTWLHFN